MTIFDHVYLEEAVRRHPRTEEVLERLKPARTTVIKRARRFFNRPGQSFTRQKENRKLILARKRDTFLYTATERIRSFGRDRVVYYNDVLRNCLYDCDYCFLQGMHRSANILFHVNLEDYLDAVDSTASAEGNLYLSVSYLTDVLGFERRLGLARYWIEAARTRPALEVEIRTKSDGFSTLRDCAPVSGVILTWSLSPDEVTRNQESGTAPFRQRLLDARRAIEAGWRVRLCFDPIIARPGWESLYPAMIEETFRRINPAGIEAVSFGVFRMNPDYYRHMPAERRVRDAAGAGATTPTATRAAADMAAADMAAATAVHGAGKLIVDEHGARSYETELREEIFRVFTRELQRYLSGDKINAVHG